MVRALRQGLVLSAAVAALTGAVGIGPRRERVPDREEPESTAPASAPKRRAGISPRVERPAPAEPASSPSEAAPSRPRVGIAPSVSPGAPAPAPVPFTRIERSETVPHRHFWHDHGGRRYSHYYDGHVHWYGWYGGSRFYWARPWGGFWWWYDPVFGRWSYWYDGHWWWGGPGGALYIYVNDDYYPYTPRAGTYERRADAATGAGEAWTSPDGRRVVEVTGADAQAVLYEKSDGSLVYLRFLGKGAQRARFSSPSPGSRATVLLEFRDGTFALFDEDGRRLDAAATPAPENAPPKDKIPAPPPPPSELPPPPETR